MKAFAAIAAVLLALGVGVALGSGVAEGDSQGGEHDLRQPRPRPDAYDCDDGCDLGRGLPVCGVDGNTYFTECLAVCQDVAVERGGACPGDGSVKVASRGKMRGRVLNMASFVGQGKVSKAEMFAYKDKKYKLIAKRTFSGMPSNETKVYKDVSLPSGREDGGRVKGGRGNKRNQDKPSSLRLLMVTADGLEYAAELSKDEIPEAVGQEASGGHIPPPSLAIDEYEEEEGDSDGRRRLEFVQKPNPYKFPDWRIGQIEYKNPYHMCDEAGSCVDDGRCTGTIIGKNKILTAAHCLYDRDEGTWTEVKLFVPGRTADDGIEAGRWGAWRYKTMFIHKQYTTVDDGEEWAWDVGILTVHPNERGEIGVFMGTVGFGRQPSPHHFTEYMKSRYSFTGYPWANHIPPGTMWNSGKCTWYYPEPEAPIIEHNCESYVGMSGSSIRFSTSSFGTGTYYRDSVIYGVHVGGFCAGIPPPDCMNGGVALNSRHLSFIRHHLWYGPVDDVGKQSNRKQSNPDDGDDGDGVPFSLEECFRRCEEKYDGDHTEGDAYYCSKGCARMSKGAVVEPTKWSDKAPAVRFDECISGCDEASSKSSRRKKCRFGCEYWCPGACISRCTAKYEGDISKGDAYSCAKGCAGLSGGEITNHGKYCKKDEDDRYDECKDDCKGASSNPEKQDMCKYGCEYWDAQRKPDVRK